jgi:hypothetical protein
MQIQLKQAEIEAALKLFISSQGINVEGKSIGITFIAGRKAGGLIADVSINDVVIPGYTDDTDLATAEVAEKAAPALAVVKAIAPVANVVAQAEVAATPAVTVAAETPPFDTAAETQAEAAPVKPVSSLFS